MELYKNIGRSLSVLQTVFHHGADLGQMTPFLMVIVEMVSAPASSDHKEY